MTSATILNTIDEYKDKIPDGLYKSLCDSLKKDFEKEEKSIGFYEVNMLKPRILPQHDQEGVEIRVLSCKRILKLEKRAFLSIEDDIKRIGYSEVHMCEEHDSSFNFFTIPTKFEMQECECETGEERCVNISFNYTPVVISIKKVDT
jgi:hypothetical protein